MEGGDKKKRLFSKAMKNKFNELAGFNHLGDEETLEIMAKAEAEGKSAKFYFETKGGAMDQIKYKYV